MFLKNRFIAFSMIAMLALGACTGSTSGDQIDKRVDELLSKMTLEEKLGQLNQVNTMSLSGNIIEDVRAGKVGSMLNESDPVTIAKLQEIALNESRLGIPILFARDVIHGFKTIMPIPLGQAATFNVDIAEKGARVAAIEATSVGIKWTFSPMIDVSRDARWGRIAESCGEDPFLNAQMGAAMIRGYQGESLSDPTSMAACAKHFIGYGATESGKDYNSTGITERAMRNIYFPPFEAAVDAGVATFMTSFNDNDGIPATANKFVLTDVLRDEWDFNGFVVTDWASATEMVTHGFCYDGADAAAKSINAGVDMEMVSGTFINTIPQLIAEGRVSEKRVDEAVRRVLRIKFELGLFENPYSSATPDQSFYADEHLAISKQAATESIILLKNESSILPLNPSKVKSVLVVGPLADAPHDQMGTWVFDGEKSATVTPLDAITAQYGNDINVMFTPGVNYSRDKNKSGIALAAQMAKRADVVLAFVGEESILSGEAHSLADISLKGAQSELIEALAATGKPLVMTVMAGRPLTIEHEIAQSDAVLFSFHPGTMGGSALADLIFGVAVPSAKTPVTFPKMVGQAPIYYAHNNTGRPAAGIETLIDEIPLEAGQVSLGCTSFYLDAGFTPLYPFGYGLSYTTFEYKNIKLSANELSKEDTLSVTFDLVNSGKYAATEVVQLYIQDKVGSVTRPVKELKAFERVFVEAGATQSVTIELPISELAFWNIDMQHVVESGEFGLWIATDSQSGEEQNFKVI